jgi:hypothetical protein
LPYRWDSSLSSASPLLYFSTRSFLILFLSQAFANLRGSPISTSISTDRGARKLQRGVRSNLQFLQAISTALALSSASVPAAPLPLPAPQKAPQKAPIPFAFATVSNNGGTTISKNTGSQGKDAVVEAANDSSTSSVDSSGKTSIKGMASGDSTVEEAELEPKLDPEPVLATTVRTVFVTQQKNTEVADLSSFIVFGGGVEAEPKLTLQEENAAKVALFLTKGDF